MPMALARVALLALLLLPLAGCGIFGKKDPERDPMKLVDFDERLAVRKAWSASVGKGTGRSGQGLRPTYADGLIWAADHDGKVFAFDARTGSRVRRIDLDMSLSAGPTVAANRVLLGTVNGQILVVDPFSGNIVWRAQLSSEVLAAPTLSEGIIVVRCIDGRVFGLDAETGLRQWVYDRSVPLLTLRGTSRPLVRGGQVYIGHDDGAVTALDLESGNLLWEQRVGVPEGRSDLERLADIDGPMAIVGLDLYSISEHDRAAALTLDSGRLLWVKELGSAQGLAVERSRLVLSDRTDRVWSLDRRSGSTDWSNEQLLRRGLTRPSVIGNFVVVADKEGYLHWLDGQTGEFVARERATRKNPASAPLVVDNFVYLLDLKGKLTAWRVGAS